MRLLCFLLAGVMTVSGVQMPVHAAEINMDQETGAEEGDDETVGEEADEAPDLTEQVPNSAPETEETEVIEDAADSEAVFPVVDSEVVSPELAVPSEPEVSDAAEMPEVGEDTDAVEDPAEPVEDTVPELKQEKAEGDPAPTITYEFTGKPNKQIYLAGEAFDRTGIQIMEKPANKPIDISSAEVTGFNPAAGGKQTVTISYQYQDQNQSQTITKTFDVIVLTTPDLTAEYGTEFSDISLPSHSDGIWTWEDTSQKADKVGKRKYKAKFTFGESVRSGIEVPVTVTCSLEKHATVTLPSETYTYDGKEKKPKVTVDVAGTKLIEKIDYKVSYSDNVNAGENTASVTVEGIGNYKDTKTEPFSIAKAKVTIRAKDKLVYCGRVPDPLTYEYEITGLANNPEDLQTLPSLDCDIESTDLPGTYDIVPSGAAFKDAVKDNYESEIEYIKGMLRVQVFVPTSVKVVGVVAADKAYDKKPWALSGTREIRESATNNLVSGLTAVPSYSGTLERTDEDGDNVVYGPTKTAPTEAGNYTVTFELGGSEEKLKDYVLDETTASYSFRIMPKTVTITAPSVMVKAGERIPDLATLNGDRKKYPITIKGFLSGDSQDSIIDITDLKLTYSESETDISADNAGEFDIIPEGAVLLDQNYAIEYVNGKLTVEGKLKFTADFTSIAVDDMTYSSQKHSISGYADGMGTFRIEVTGKTRKEEEGGDGGDNYSKKAENVAASNIVSKYGEIAPVEVGEYTLKIFSELDPNLYDCGTDPLVTRRFQILPLQKNETKLVGVSGVTNKVYDAKAVDLSEQIRNAQVRTDREVDITDKVNLEIWIKGVKSTDSVESGYEDTKFDKDAPDVSKMPVDAGEYRLVFKIVADESENYISNEWSIPFVIGKRPLTLTVMDMKIPVNADGILPDPSAYQYTITDDTITDEEDKILSNNDFDRPLIMPAGEVDTTKAGSYDLVASGDIAGDQSRNYEVTYVSGKLFVQTKLWGVKEFNLTGNKNIPHGKTLEEIAETYLPKTAVIYLDKDKMTEGSAAIEWDTKNPASGVYNISSKAAQNFKMKGTLVLPDFVYADESDKTLLTVLVDVRVREANDGTQALKPYADKASGTVGPGTQVSLSTDEEGAEIYYTIEADNPALSVTSRRYTAPIEIKCTMVIRAVSRVYGKMDSEELRLTYYYNKNLKPGGDVDPDDPDTPNVPDEDVPKDEDGNPLEIPKDLWVTDVAQYTYSGKAIRPQVRVYDYKTRLEEKKDYTISYKNNVNAADKNNPTKAPTIVIKGKGNYEGKLNKTFTIAPKNISDMHEEGDGTKKVKVYDVKMDDITVGFVDNKAQKPVVTASWDGKKLVNKKDFTYEAVPNTAVGTYPIKVTGNGNYTGERQVSFTITNAVPASMFTVYKIADYTYTGQEIKPTVVVTYKKAVLQLGKEYTLSFEDNREIGTASAVIKGMGRFSGTKRVNFKIKEAAVLNKAQAELQFASGTVYTGAEIKPSVIKLAVQAKQNGAVETRVLTENDYKVTYEKNVNAGTAVAVFEGIGAYSGTLKKTFKITPYNIQNMQPDQITVQASCPYMKGGSKPKPVIQFAGKTLREGTDYTVSYKKNTTVGGTAVMTIKGKGNFTGSVTRTFQVTIRDISNITVDPADKVYQAKAGSYKTKVRVLDSNGKALTAGKDYDKKVVYTYGERLVLPSGEVKSLGDPVAESDIVPAGTKIRVSVTAVGTNYRGTAMGIYSIIQADVAKAKVTVPAMTYTGKPVEPGKQVITVTLNGIPLAAEEYEIVGYSNNLNKGTAKLTIRGLGSYGGTKTVSFRIKGKNLFTQLLS